VLLFGYLDELTVINLNAIHKVIADIEEEASLVTDEFHDVLPTNTNTNNINTTLDANNSFEERIMTLEKIVGGLQQTLNKERALLRKAILLQLDMDSIYEENS
jgi:hypothetical protein